jgi:hypothetical protein
MKSVGLDVFFEAIHMQPNYSVGQTVTFKLMGNVVEGQITAAYKGSSCAAPAMYNVLVNAQNYTVSEPHILSAV